MPGEIFEHVLYPFWWLGGSFWYMFDPFGRPAACQNAMRFSDRFGGASGSQNVEQTCDIPIGFDVGWFRYKVEYIDT